MTTIKYNQEVRAAVMSGVDKLANAVKITLGPKGRNVIISRDGLDPIVTKDGVTVAKAVELDDEAQNIGATLVKRVAEKSNSKAGDGTTTATVLTQAILKEGNKLVSAGYDPVEIQKGINWAADKIIDQLNKMSINIEFDSELVEQIATISANNDHNIGKIVAEAFKSVGTDGAVSVEEGSGFETVVHKVDGLQFDRGLLSTYFSNSPEHTEVLMKNPLIAVVDGKLTTTEQAMSLIEPITKLGRGVVIIAEDVVGDALTTLILNKMRGGHSIASVKAPGFGDYRSSMMSDIAAIVGARVIPIDRVNDVKDEHVEQLFGSASSIKIEQMSTVIMGGKRDEIEVKNRINEIEADMKRTDITTFEKDKLKERKAKLSGGVAIIEVGAKSEVEMKEIKDRIDDAKEAVISALEEGVVPGGGMALINAKQLALKDTWEYSSDSFEKGAEILLYAIEAPFKRICLNAGVSPDVKLEGVLCRPTGTGYNAKTDEYVEMFDEGILDPKKVTRVALEGASSVAGTLLTTQCMLVKH